jgi:hypothetical protein
MMCKPHWYTLPKSLRDRIWATYRPGQEVTKDPSDEYLVVFHEVRQWCLAYMAKQASLLKH